MDSEPGTYTWGELMTDDRSAALRFYEQVFGLTTRAVDLGGSPFTTLLAGDVTIGGIIPPQRAESKNRWVVYFAVTDVAATARVGLQVVTVGLLGLAVDLQQQTIQPREDRAATVSDGRTPTR